MWQVAPVIGLRRKLEQEVQSNRLLKLDKETFYSLITGVPYNPGNLCARRKISE